MDLISNSLKSCSDINNYIPWLVYYLYERSSRKLSPFKFDEDLNALYKKNKTDLHAEQTRQFEVLPIIKMTTIPLHILQLQFKCQLLDDLFCPADKLGNTLRGAFGMAFKRLSCVKSGGCEGYCTGECLYGQVFEPKITNGPGPSGLVDPPRPFVFVPMPHGWEKLGWKL